MPDASASPSIRDALRVAMTAAVRRRDPAALSVYRTALAAIDNAEAVPLTDNMPPAGAIEASAVSVGATEVERQELSEEQMRVIVDGEIAERQHAADHFERHGSQTDRARALRNEAMLLQTLRADTK